MTTDSTHIAHRVIEATAGPARLLMLPTPVRDVVSFRGSVGTGLDYGTDEDIRQSLVADLLEKGTHSKDRFDLAEAVEDRGAKLGFSSGDLRISWSGKSLRADLSEMLSLTAEMLREPAFDADEVNKAQVRAVASIRRAMESTGTQASALLRRRLFPEAHPTYALEPEHEQQLTEAITREDLAAFHAAHVGSDGMLLAVAGDFDPETVTAAVKEVFGDWGAHGHEAHFAEAATPEAPDRAIHPMPDKNNLDVRLGHALALRRDDPDYLAVFVGVFALGGNFSSRLMQTVRDEMGLTYGIRAGLRNVSPEYDCRVQVNVTLSREHLLEGTRATREVVRRFVEEGITQDELARTKSTIAGSHVVSLATSSGLAHRLLRNAEHGFDVAYIDELPERIKALTVERVNEAVRAHVRPGELHETVAGTLPE